MSEPVAVYYASAREDEELLNELEKHLAPLSRKGIVSGWHRGQLCGGDDGARTSMERLESARVIVLLVSADFIAAEDEPTWQEMERAIERSRAGSAHVVPVILRACGWREAPFADPSLGLRALPEASPGHIKAVTSWANRDEAWAAVVEAIAEAIKTNTITIPKTQSRSLPVNAAVLETESSDIPPGEAAPSSSDARSRVRAASPMPSYADDAARARGEELAEAYATWEAAQRAGGPAETIEAARAQIQKLRYAMREGGQLRPGDFLDRGRYRLLRRIGRGGFAFVWKAFDRDAGDIVAVKVLHASLAEDEKRRARFFRGARFMAEVGHEAVVKIRAPQEVDDGFYYFVMDYIDGLDLHRAVKDLSPERVLPVILRVGEALAAAHAKGIVHRDVKPANILLDASSEPKLTDFDLVAAAETSGGTRTGGLGTVLYAAPECLDQPQHADARADVYGLGMTAVFCLYGKDPPYSKAVYETAQFVASLPCGPAVRQVLLKAINRNREERFNDAAELCDALRSALASDEALAKSPAPPSPKPAKRALAVGNWVVIGAVGLAAILSVVSLWQSGKPRPLDEAPAATADQRSEKDKEIERLTNALAENQKDQALIAERAKSIASNEPASAPPPTPQGTRAECDGVDLLRNSAHCGECGWSCAGAPCEGGQCQPVRLAIDTDAPTKIVAHNGSVFWINTNSDTIGVPPGATGRKPEKPQLSPPPIKNAKSSRVQHVDIHLHGSTAYIASITNTLRTGAKGLVHAYVSSCPITEGFLDCGSGQTWTWGPGKPSQIAVHERLLYVTDDYQHKVLRIDLGTPTPLAQPEAIASSQQSPGPILADESAIHWINRGIQLEDSSKNIYAYENGSLARLKKVPIEKIDERSGAVASVLREQQDTLLTSGGYLVAIAANDQHLYLADRGDYTRRPGKDGISKGNGRILRLRKSCNIVAACPPETLLEAVGAPDSGGPASVRPRSLAVDGGVLYWSDSGDAKGGFVYCAKSDGSDPVVIARGHVEPRSLAVDDMFVYWITSGPKDGGTVWRARKCRARSK